MSKTNKQRGARTAGRGRGKSHNCNAGNRGGRGRAGSGKKGDAKKSMYWKTESFGKKAFGMISGKDVSVINVGLVNSRVEALVAAGKVKSDKAVSLDLGKLGFEKLLGSGKITNAVTVTVAAASESAIAKIEAAGGKVIVGKEEISAVAE